MDDCRLRDPPRRGADRTRSSATAAARTACSCGSTFRRRSSSARRATRRSPALTSCCSALPTAARSIRLIAGDLAGHSGPGVTHTPITYAHASLRPGARLERAVEPGVQRPGLRPQRPRLRRRRRSTARQPPTRVFGPGRPHHRQAAADAQPEDSPDLEVLLLGGLPIREPIAHYGPFLMNTRAEILTAIDDYPEGPHGRDPRGRAVPLRIRSDAAPCVVQPAVSTNLKSSAAFDDCGPPYSGRESSNARIWAAESAERVVTSIRTAVAGGVRRTPATVRRSGPQCGHGRTAPRRGRRWLRGGRAPSREGSSERASSQSAYHEAQSSSAPSVMR